MFLSFKVTHEKDGVSVRFNWDEGELFDQEAATCLFQACQDINLAEVVKVESHPKSKWRPMPMDTIVNLFNITSFSSNSKKPLSTGA
jgi:DNA topoisomerase III